MLSRYLQLLRSNRNFRLLWAAQVVSELGDWFYSLAVYSLLLELTHDRAQSVALAVVLQVLPATFAAPAVGTVNDRLPRKQVMIASDVARFFVVLGMLAVRTPGTVWLAYLLLFAETVGASFFAPAQSAVVPNVVAPGDVLTANALGSITWSFCLTAGSAIGGVAAVLLGRDAVFVLNALSFLASAWLIRRMTFEEPHAANCGNFRAPDLLNFAPLAEGARYLRADKRRFATLFVKCGIGILGANNVLLPILGQRVFPAPFAGVDAGRAGLLGMSLLMGARGAGSLIGPVIAGKWVGDSHSRMGAGIVIGFLCAAAGYVLLGLSGTLALAAAMVVLGHAGLSTNWVFSTTLLQFYTGDRFRGRVFAAENGLFMLTISASSYAAGAALDLGTPARLLAIALGAAMLAPAAAWGWAMVRTGVAAKGS